MTIYPRAPFARPLNHVLFLYVFLPDGLFFHGFPCWVGASRLRQRTFHFLCCFQKIGTRVYLFLGDIGRSAATIDSSQLYTICFVTFRSLDDVLFVTLGFRNIWRRKSTSYYVVILGCLSWSALLRCNFRTWSFSLVSFLAILRLFT